MAQKERVTLKIEIDVDDGALGKLERRLKRFEKSVNQSSRRMQQHSNSADKLDRKFNSLNRTTQKTDRQFNKLGRTAQKVGKMFTKFLSTLAKFSFIVYAGQVAILTTALLGAKLAMASGRVAAQGYQIALRGVGAAAAGVATAVAVAAAAMQQFQAASLAPFAGGFDNSNRSLMSQSSAVRGLLGSENSAKVLKHLAINGVGAPNIASTQRGLLNLAGGDAAATEQLAASLGSSTKFSEALAGTPGGAGAFEASGMSASQFAATQSSGGQVDLLSGTVVGTLKTQFVTVIDQFAQVGLSLLEPVRESIIAMGGTVRSFSMQLIPAINKFAELVLGSKGGLASGFQRMADSLARLANKVMPTFEGQMGRLGSMAEKVEMFFFRMGERLSPLEEGAEVLMDMFGAMWAGMTGNGVLANFNKTLKENAATFHALGDSIGNLFQAFLGGSGGGASMVGFVNQLTNVFNTAATDLVPPLREVANALKEIILGGLPPVLTAIGGILAALAPLMNVVASVGGAGNGMGAAGMLVGSKIIGGRGGRGGRSATARPGRGGGRMSMGPMMLAAGGAMVAGQGFSGASKDGAGTGDYAMGVGGSAALGAAIGSVIPGLGTALGAGIGAGVGLFTTKFLGGKAEKRRAGNLDTFMGGFGELKGFDSVDAFNAAMANTDELASQLDMDAEDLTDRLNIMQPAMDSLHRSLEAEIAPDIEFLTEVLGYSSEAALEMAKSLTDMEMAATRADAFNAMIDDLTGLAVSGSSLVENTAEGKAGQDERNQALINRIGAMGGLSGAMQTAEGRLLVGETVDSLTATARQRGETVTGAGVFALDTLEATFGRSGALRGLEMSFEDMLASAGFSNVVGANFELTKDNIDAFAGGDMLSQVAGKDGQLSSGEMQILGTITQEVQSNVPMSVTVNGVIDPAVKDQLLNEFLDAAKNLGISTAEATAASAGHPGATGSSGVTNTPQASWTNKPDPDWMTPSTADWEK